MGFFEEMDQDDIAAQEELAQQIENGEEVEEPADGESSMLEEDPYTDLVNELMDESDEATLESAAVRLDQARLYEMLAKHNMFEGVEASQAAIRKVQKEMKDFVMDRLAILLGMKQEQSKSEQPQSFQVKLPFNPLEIEVLKDLAKAASKGATLDVDEEEVAVATPVSLPKVQPKPALTLKTIKGAASPRQAPSYQHKRSASVPTPKVRQKTQAVPQKPARPVVKPLEKDPREMEPQELKERNELTKGAYAGKKANNPNRKPIISGEQSLAMWSSRQAQHREQNDFVNLATGGKAVNVEDVSDTSDDYTPGY